MSSDNIHTYEDPVCLYNPLLSPPLSYKTFQKNYHSLFLPCISIIWAFVPITLLSRCCKVPNNSSVVQSDGWFSILVTLDPPAAFDSTLHPPSFDSRFLVFFPVVQGPASPVPILSFPPLPHADGPLLRSNSGARFWGPHFLYFTDVLSKSVALFHQILVLALSLSAPPYATTHVRSSHVALQVPEAVCLSFLFDICSLCSSNWVIFVDLQIYWPFFCHLPSTLFTMTLWILILDLTSFQFYNFHLILIVSLSVLGTPNFLLIARMFTSGNTAPIVALKSLFGNANVWVKFSHHLLIIFSLGNCSHFPGSLYTD